MIVRKVIVFVGAVGVKKLVAVDKGDRFCQWGFEKKIDDRGV